MNAFEKELRELIKGDVHFDTIHKKIYSVDASIYEIEPIGIVLPNSLEDLRRAVQIAYRHQVTIIPRGAATGITGGCIGHGLVLDTSKYLNKILDVNYQDEYVVCEPGVVQDELNHYLSAAGYRLGPDTSTGNRATIGGMLANNAAGAHSLLYGKMVDHVLEIELILANGDIITLKNLDQQAIKDKCSLETQEGEIYREILRICTTNRHEIDAHFPKIPRRASGYNLDELVKTLPSLNLCKIMAGSEGTLGIFAKIKMKICKVPQLIGISIIHSSNMLEGMRHINQMLAFKPNALELIDHKILESGRNAPSMRGKLDWLIGNPDAVFFAEFAGPTEEDIVNKISAFEAKMKSENVGYAYVSLLKTAEISTVWEVRKAGLGLLLSRRSYSRAIAFLEDISIPPHQLASFMEKFCSYLKAHGKEAGIYGHVGSGCMHVRPYIDMRSSDDLKLMEKMMEDISDLLLEYGGALSGEHGDGLVRSWLNKKMFGETLYKAFVELKAAFDPNNRLNPGKIVHATPLLQNLRLAPDTPFQPIKTFLDFKREGGFELAVDLCNGNGLCRKSEKTMCPSFQVTHDEYDSTRARAQTLRSIVNGKMPLNAMNSTEVADVLDLCLECKACKTECPSEVDMAKMKAEFLYQYHTKNGFPLRSKVFAYIGKLNQFGSLFPALFNASQNNFFSKWIFKWLGITVKRPLPALTKQRFSAWFQTHQPIQSNKKVILFNDTFTEFNQPEIGIAAVKVLESLGYQVIVPTWSCCGRPAISKGLLEYAKQQAEALIERLYPYANEKIAIVGLEPSCLLTIKDDLTSLVGYHNGEISLKADAIIKQCITFDKFLNNHLVNGQLPLNFEESNIQIKVHGHCHQKSLVGMHPTLKVLKGMAGVEVSEIPSGCCGLAGSFGYEAEHYDFSMKIGELKLFPAIRSSDEETVLIANGMSCRSQITHGTERKAYHLAEFVATRIKKDKIKTKF